MLQSLLARPAHVSALLASASLVAGAIVATPIASEPGAAPDDAVLTLLRIVETRTADINLPREDEGMMFMASQQAGLSLVFSVKLPPSLKIMSLQQPAKVIAADSAGADLSKIEPGFSDEVEYVDLEHDFKDDDDLSEITLQLAASSRKAETFDVHAEFSAKVFTGSKPVPLSLTADWTALPADLADVKSSMRIRATDEGIAIEPASIEDWLESLQLHVGENEMVESNGWFSDGTTITYMFDQMPEGRPLKATMNVRTGVRTIPLMIELKKQALP